MAVSETSLSEIKNRIPWIDNARAIGLSLIFLGHLLEIYITRDNAGAQVRITFSLIYSFHVPLFFFLSGIVFRERTKVLYKDVFIAFISLYIPFIFFELVSFFYNFVVLFWQIRNIDVVFEYFRQLMPDFRIFLEGYQVFSATSWFFSCLLAVQVIYLVAARFIRSSGALFASAIMFSIVGYFAARAKSGNFGEYVLGDVQGFFYIQSALVALCFFQIGILMRDFIRKMSIPTSYIIFAAVPLWLGLSWLNLKNLPMLHDKVQASLLNGLALGDYFLYFPAAFLGIASVIIISKAIPGNRVMGYVGRNSLYFVGLNGLVFAMQDYLYFPGLSGSRMFLPFAVLLVTVNMILFAPLVSALAFLWSRGRSCMLGIVS